jgi:hypothetical protein
VQFLVQKLLLQLLVEKLVFQLLVERHELDTIAALKSRLGVWVQVAHQALQALQVRDWPCL